MCVTELAASEQESLSTISQRLRVLRSENLIIRRRRGKHINYALADQHVMDLVFNALAHATERPASVPSQPTGLEKEEQLEPRTRDWAFHGRRKGANEATEDPRP
jgi:DNA-binding transcriptional ArsR family regulator